MFGTYWINDTFAEEGFTHLAADGTGAYLAVAWRPQSGPLNMDAALGRLVATWSAGPASLRGILVDAQLMNQLVPEVDALARYWGSALVAAGCRRLAFVEPLTIPGQLSVAAWIGHVEAARLPLHCAVFTDLEAAHAWLGGAVPPVVGGLRHPA